MILANTINFFEDISQYSYNDKYVDFHNNTSLENILFHDDVLSLKFKHDISGKFLSLRFTGVKISQITFFNSKEVENLTIDNLYRGRFEDNEILKDISDEEAAYFYLEFCEGQKMEFWAKKVGLDE